MGSDAVLCCARYSVALCEPLYYICAPLWPIKLTILKQLKYIAAEQRKKIKKTKKRDKNSIMQGILPLNVNVVVVSHHFIRNLKCETTIQSSNIYKREFRQKIPYRTSYSLGVF